jgi:hypothetical protein
LLRNGERSIGDHCPAQYIGYFPFRLHWANNLSKGRGELVGCLANMQVHQGAFDICVAHHLLDRDDVDTIFQKVGSIGMTQHVGVHSLEMPA